MNWFRQAGVLALFLAGCEPMGASWQLTDSLGLESAVVAEGVEEAETEPMVDDRFPSEEELKRIADPLGQADDEPVEEVEPGGELAEEASEAEEPTEPEGTLEEAAQPDAPPVVVPDSETQPPPQEEPDSARVNAAVAGLGAPQSPGWGVRLVASIPEAQPPRAVLGLPSGEEVVVSPGSMIPEAAVVVIAVGPGTVVLAEITPEGDHAKVEQRTLHAQYKTGVPGTD
ncbi:MAG: hypothetical protein VX519_07470 [Myxococcota bacterium]|nr:hypothetical protein [Myxococcota bacterium]